MSNIKGVVLLGMPIISGVASSRGVVTLAEQHKVLTEGLAEAIAAKFADPKNLGKLGELIFQQKQAHILHMSEADFELFLKWRIDESRESNEMFKTLMKKEAKGELTDEKARSFLVRDNEDSVAAHVFGGIYDAYSDNDVRGSIQGMWDKITAMRDKVGEIAAIEDVDVRRQAVADYFATSQQQTVVGFLMLVQLGKTGEQFNGYAAPSVDMQSAVKEMYIDTLSYKELESLARALDLDDLLLAAETPIDRLARMGERVRKVKTEKIDKLSKVLARIAEKKQAVAQKEQD